MKSFLKSIVTKTFCFVIVSCGTPDEGSNENRLVGSHEVTGTEEGVMKCAHGRCESPGSYYFDASHNSKILVCDWSRCSGAFHPPGRYKVDHNGSILICVTNRSGFFITASHNAKVYVDPKIGGTIHSAEVRHNAKIFTTEDQCPFLGRRPPEF